MEEKYYELLERKDRAIDNYHKVISERTPCPQSQLRKWKRKLLKTNLMRFVLMY